MKLPRMLALAALVLPSLALADGATTLLEQMRQAHGATAFRTHDALVAEGRETIDGLQGDWRSTIDLRGDHFITRSENSVFASAEGIDDHGRWRMDVTNQIHPIDSAEGKAVGKSEAWLRRMGFLSVDDGTSYRVLGDAEDSGRRYQRIEATPPGAKSIALWIDPQTHRLHRASWNASFLTISRRFSDYRDVDGVQLPFRIASTGATVSGGEDGAGTDVVERYRWVSGRPADAWRRPDATVRDVTMTGDAKQAKTPMWLEGGVLLVQARINGHAPMPFILDTGGHAILTTDAALRLGVTPQGQGVSTGSGPGSMSLAYAKIDHLALGQADLHNQVFLVMPYGYAFSERGEGKEPIAGILGLEIFERFAVTFDYDRGELVLQPFDHGDAPAAKQGTTLPLFFTDDMPLVDAKLDGKSGIFGIDTGNSGMLLLFPQWARQVGIIDRYEHGTPIPTGGVGGLFTAHVARGQSLELGDQPITPVTFMLTQDNAGATGNPTEAANIGQDVLYRYNVHFDYRRGHMVLMPRAKPVTRNYATAGFSATKDAAKPDRYQVSFVLAGSAAEAAGLKKGDEFTAINGKPATTLGRGTLRDESNNLPVGTPVRVTMADGRVLELKARDIAGT